MDPMTQFMSQSHHVTWLAQIVQHDIWVHGRDGRVCKCTGGLARFDASVDPALAKEWFGNVSHTRVKGAVGIHDDLLGLVPFDGAIRFHREGGVAIPNL